MENIHMIREKIADAGTQANLYELRATLENYLFKGDAADRGLGLSEIWEKSFNLFAPLQMTISALNYAGDDQLNDEFIELFNKGPAILDISGWTLEAGSPDQRLVFPAGSLIQPLSMIRIYTAQRGSYYFGSERPIWNNRGDEALLYDHNMELVSSWCYGNKAHQYVDISYINVDGEQERTEGDEYIELTNFSKHRVDLSGWQINASSGNSFTFDVGTYIEPNGKLRIYTNKQDLNANELSFNCKRAIWNNTGGGGNLLDHLQMIVSEYHYGFEPQR